MTTYQDFIENNRTLNKVDITANIIILLIIFILLYFFYNYIL